MEQERMKQSSHTHGSDRKEGRDRRDKCSDIASRARHKQIGSTTPMPTNQHHSELLPRPSALHTRRRPQTPLKAVAVVAVGTGGGLRWK